MTLPTAVNADVLRTYKIWIVLGICLLLVGVSFVISLTVGSRSTGFMDSLRVMPESLRYAFDSNYAANMAFNDLVVLIGGLRVPRTVLALLTGVALGGAGALIQGHTRNPLADPHILGINAGAALAVVIAVYAGVGTEPGNLVLPAIIGCAITAGLVFLISSFGPVAMNPLALILAGVALAALFMGLVNALVLNNSLSLDALRAWSTGSVGDRDMGVVRAVFWPFLIGAVLCLFQGRGLNLLSLGESVAATLGLPVTRTRILGLTTVALLGGAAVAGAGPVGFIGLAAPHIVRAIAGHDYRIIIPLSMVVGGMLGLWADILGRVVAHPGEIAMGIVVALFGVPLFIVLVKRGLVTEV